MEITEKDEDKKILITESRSIWNQGNLRKNEYQYGTDLLKIISFWYFSVFKSCNFFVICTALLENEPGWLETSCSNKHLAVKEVFEFWFCASFEPLKYYNPRWTSKLQNSKWLMKGSPKVWTGMNKVCNTTPTQNSWYPLDPFGEIE